MPDTNKIKLSIPHQIFVDNYLKTNQITRSYQDAYPDCKSLNAAHASGSRLLSSDTIKQYLDEIKNKVLANTVKTATSRRQELTEEIYDIRQEAKTEKKLDIRLKCVDSEAKLHSLYNEEKEDGGYQTFIQNVYNVNVGRLEHRPVPVREQGSIDDHSKDEERYKLNRQTIDVSPEEPEG